MTNLEKLAELTEQLPPVPLPDAVLFMGSDRVEYRVERGECFGYALLVTRRIAMQRCHMTRGTIFPNHNHDVREWIFVESGMLVFFSKRGAERIRDGEWIHFPVGLAHSCEALQDTWLIGITMPPAEGYPK